MRTTVPAAAVLVASVLLASGARADGESYVPPALAPFAEALQPLPASAAGIEGRTYVPVHSSVMAIGGETRIDFSITLSVHNPSATRPIVVERIDYHDTAGRLVEARLDRPVALRPFGTIQVVVTQPDTRAGLGADFVVDWTAPTASIEPIVEAVMISSHGSQGYAFSTVGRKVER
ncbi:MAG: DUF3124 domain-containing protein [Phyllobacteriaceae bacterium]|nr:DUF3124 domain-containing protein [Phyllobacteriaceae bacterium]